MNLSEKTIFTVLVFIGLFALAWWLDMDVPYDVPAGL